ncbi:MAG: 16S rRNA (uracil(1498)-N(3))-methyltransferase [Alistipes sp.]
MQLFYAPDIIPPFHTLSEEESKHCIRVLRLQCGDLVHITDGRGNLFFCNIIDSNPKRCTVEVSRVETHFEQLSYQLTMAVAPTKNADRFEWFLEKATEVGVGTIIPLESEHSERRVFKYDRSEKVIFAAMKQSLKAYCPNLQELTPFKAVVSAPFSGRKFIAHCDLPATATGKSYLPDTLHKGEAALILIGPEGDFSPEEIRLALANGFEEITLGTQRLRTETAAVTAVVMVSVVNGSAHQRPTEDPKQA